jgi:hypothetical protein
MTKSGENATVRRRDGGDGEVIHERERGGEWWSYEEEEEKHSSFFITKESCFLYLLISTVKISNRQMSYIG